MRDGVKLFTAVYVPEGRRRRPYPILLTRTPYSVGPYGVGQRTGTTLGPSPPFAQRRLHLRLPGRARAAACPRASSSTCGRTSPRKTGRRDIDESTDTYDTIDWLVKNVPEPQRQGRHVGHLVPRLLRGGGHDRRAPGAARPPRRRRPIADWFIGDDFHHNGALFLPHAFNFYRRLRPAAPGADDQVRPTAFDHGTPDGYDFFLDARPARRTPTRSTSRARSPFWNELMAHPTYDDFWQARNLRPHLKNIKPGRDDRRRLVRRRGPLRRARDLPRGREAEPAAPPTRS